MMTYSHTYSTCYYSYNISIVIPTSILNTNIIMTYANINAQIVMLIIILVHILYFTLLDETCVLVLTLIAHHHSPLL